MHHIKIKNQIQKFDKVLSIEGDKSLSIRWALLASQAEGISKSLNLLKSEDVLSTLTCLRKLGVKVKIKKDVASKEQIAEVFKLLRHANLVRFELPNCKSQDASLNSECTLRL